MNFEELASLLRNWIPPSTRPILVYSALWQIARSFPVEFRTLPERLCHLLIDIGGPNRTILMPTYTNGFKDGRIDLDEQPSTTGVLSEVFRKQPGAERTASAFFSFSALGPEARYLSELRPRNAWGDDSVFGWLEQTDAHIVTMGAFWNSCSFRHRVEWKAQVPYRFRKELQGTMIRHGKEEPLKECLFVRQKEPHEIENVWPDCEALFAAFGMQSHPLGTGQIAEMSAKKIIDALLPPILENPYAYAQAKS